MASTSSVLAASRLLTIVNAFPSLTFGVLAVVADALVAPSATRGRRPVVLGALWVATMAVTFAVGILLDTSQAMVIFVGIPTFTASLILAIRQRRAPTARTGVSWTLIPSLLLMPIVAVAMLALVGATCEHGCP